MARHLTLVIGVVLAIGFAVHLRAQPSDALASGKTAQEFQGYWMGIDPLDGGDSRRSLVRQNNGRFAMAGRDTVLTLCDETDRGYISFDDGVLTARNVLQSENTTLACSNIGASVTIRVAYELVASGVMIEHSTTIGGNPVSRIVFHKVSQAFPK